MEVKVVTLVERLLQDFHELPNLLRTKQQQEFEKMMDDIIIENQEAFLELAK